jgi:hypothetical protein
MYRIVRQYLDTIDGSLVLMVEPGVYETAFAAFHNADFLNAEGTGGSIYFVMPIVAESVDKMKVAA